MSVSKPASSSSPPSCLRASGAGRNGYCHNQASGTRPSRPAISSILVRWYVDKIAPAQTAFASGCAAMTLRSRGLRDSVSSSSSSSFLFALQTLLVGEAASFVSRYILPASTAPPMIGARYSGIPNASSYSGITDHPIVWYMKLSMSSAVSGCVESLSLLLLVAGIGGGWRFANATTLWPLRMQCRIE
ncbi:hypothetical protein BDW67DRAFT_164016 [Aspergillus spinulosporus]